MLTAAKQKLGKELLSLLMRYRRASEIHDDSCLGATCNNCHYHHQKKILRAIEEQNPLTLILPAFPAKSANRQKTISAKPDKGEIMGLSILNQICKSMQELYQPGVQLVICSDGRVFNDLVLVSDADVDIYQEGIHQIIHEYGLVHLSTFSLDEVYENHDYQTMRTLLMKEYGQSLDELREQIKHDHRLAYQFDGIHRFIIEDQLAIHLEHSKNQIRKASKPIAYEVIRRSNAWSRLLAEYFPKSLRLSIHPQACGSDKMGIQFLPATNRWATPWHNVLLKSTQGWQLVKRRDAEQMGAILNHDHYILEDF